MKSIVMSGEQIKRDNGSGYRLSDAFPKRKFRNETLYFVRWNGVQLDKSTVVSIEKAN